MYPSSRAIFATDQREVTAINSDGQYLRAHEVAADRRSNITSDYSEPDESDPRQIAEAETNPV